MPLQMSLCASVAQRIRASMAATCLSTSLPSLPMLTFCSTVCRGVVERRTVCWRRYVQMALNLLYERQLGKESRLAHYV